MRKVVKNLKELFLALPPRWNDIEDILSKNILHEAEMAELAYSVAEECFCEYSDALYYCDEDESKIDYSLLHSTYLLQSLKILLQYGLNPNAETEDGHNVMGQVRYVNSPNVAASAMRLLLENGANPNLMTSNEAESTFQELDFEVGDDEYLNHSNRRITFQCWLVMIAYGACYLNGEIPIKMLNNYPVSIFKNFENYDYEIEMLPQKEGYYGCWIMHVLDMRTGEKVARLE